MLSEELKYKILKIFHENPEISQRDLSKQLGISLGKVNYCVKALVEKGFVKIRNFQNRENKAHYLYLLTPHGIKEKAQVTLRFLQAKISEFEQINNEISQLKNEVAANGHYVEDNRAASLIK